MYLMEAEVNHPDVGSIRRTIARSQTSESQGPTIESAAVQWHPLSPRGKLGELGGMRDNLELKTGRDASRVVAWATMALLVAGSAMAAEPASGSRIRPVAPSEALARRAGLRLLESKHLVLATDRPVREGDGVAELPYAFDRAFEAWCEHYEMNPADHADWRCFGCLVVDRERFRAAGLLPDTLPPFENGFCDRNHFWLIDQSNPAYRRHLLLHEGVHAFTLTLRGLATPVWYNEGIAEYLATHKLEPGAKGILKFESTPIPERLEDVEQLGRIEKLSELRATGTMPSLADVLALPVGNHKAVADYAASWAAVAMLAKHPAYAKAFAKLERGPLGYDFNKRLASMPGWDAERASRDFDAFSSDIDYGYDFPRSSIDWSPGIPLVAPRRFDVDATRGWQNSGLALVAGKRYAFKASGRVGLGLLTDPKTDELLVDPKSDKVISLEGEADGISLEWYRGRPTGRLLLGQWIAKPADGRRPRFEILAEGASGEFVAAAEAPLFMRLNGPPARLAKREGTISAVVQPTP